MIVHHMPVEAMHAHQWLHLPGVAPTTTTHRPAGWFEVVTVWGAGHSTVRVELAEGPTLRLPLHSAIDIADAAPPACEA